MNRHLGAFTCYGIEYVFDYLGEERIKKKIEELRDTSVVSMGLNLKEFTYNEPFYSYYFGKGVIWIFDTLIQWFDDFEFHFYLYQSSKMYTAYNYYESGLLKEKKIEFINTTHEYNKRKNGALDISRDIVKDSYWIDYHFFYLNLSKRIKKEIKKLKECQVDLVGTYEMKKNKLYGPVELELKKRRKPSSGKYLMCRDVMAWYDLILKEENEDFSSYFFTKNGEEYNLIVENKSSTARIELSDNLSIKKYAQITFPELLIMRDEIIKDYTSNFDIISKSIKQSFLLSPNEVLSNGIMWDIHDFYEKSNNPTQASAIARLNNKYLDVWKEIPEDYD